MTDNEIIKALDCCKTNNCDECPFYGVKEDCEVELPEEAFDLINRQKAIIEKSEKVEHFADKTIETANAEIERLEKELMKCKLEKEMLYQTVEEIKSETIKEFAEKIDKFLERYSHIHEDVEKAMSDVIEHDDEMIEMQSVWDVHTLIANEMGSEPEEMNRLQDNIETIAKERLLKEIEKDLRLLVKEMTEVETNHRKEDDGR